MLFTFVSTVSGLEFLEEIMSDGCGTEATLADVCKHTMATFPGTTEDMKTAFLNISVNPRDSHQEKLPYLRPYGVSW